MLVATSQFFFGAWRGWLCVPPRSEDLPNVLAGQQGQRTRGEEDLYRQENSCCEEGACSAEDCIRERGRGSWHAEIGAWPSFGWTEVRFWPDRGGCR
jgi:hypothetical protein